MHRLHEKSHSPIDFTIITQTERSENLSQTSRNSIKNLLDLMPQNNANSNQNNNSQILTKDKSKSSHLKANNRKKSISSYYLKNSYQQIIGSSLKYQNSNDLKRKRCQTTFNSTTNKNKKNSQLDEQICIINLEPQQYQLNNPYFCVNHPEKKAYFEDLNLSQCYCHQCTIQNVKQNKKIIQLTPEIIEIKQIISKKIIQAQSFGEQLCIFVQKMVDQSISSLFEKYKDLKNTFSSKRFQQNTQEQYFDFNLKEIDWKFMDNICNKQLNISQFSPLNFLSPKTKNYKMIKKMNSETDVNNITQESISQFTYFSPIRQKSVVNGLSHKKLMKSQNSNLSSKNLMKQIEKALHQQSKIGKVKIKKVNLNVNRVAERESVNKQNIEPNIMRSLNTDLKEHRSIIKERIFK